MAAYILVDIEVRDPEGYREYTDRVVATQEPFQGKPLIRGGAYETLEGEWQPSRIVLLEFPTVEQARAWYTSPAYQAIRPIRQQNSHANIFTLIEGVPES